MFTEKKYDFFATIFLNIWLKTTIESDSGGKYAELRNLNAVARIMAVPILERRSKSASISVIRSAGPGTLLTNIAHAIGENCTIYSEDISRNRQYAQTESHSE